MRIRALCAFILTAAPLCANTSQQRAFLDKYCVSCHNERTKIAGLMLDKLDVSNLSAQPDKWEKLPPKLRSGMMPPPGAPRPDQATRQAFVSWLESSLDESAAAHPNAGRTETFHRLNRSEYQNSVRDALAVRVDVSSLLPADDLSYGFDNIAGVLKMSPVLMERYTSAATKIARVATGSADIQPSEETFRPSSDLAQDDYISGMPFGTRGGMTVHYNFPLDAEYVIKLKLARDYLDTLMTYSDPHRLELRLDGKRLQIFDVKQQQYKVSATLNRFFNPPNQDVDANFRIRIPIKAGPREIQVGFLQKTNAFVETELQPNVRPLTGAFADTRYEPYLGSVTVSGPFAPTGPGDTPSRRQIFTCRPSRSLSEIACARQIVTALARRLYRRPVTDDDTEVLLSFYQRGRNEGSFDKGIEMAVRRLLMSPEFLFRIERDPEGVTAGTNYRVSDLELASRLSFFLWSSGPDETLLDLAVRKRLHDPQILEQQVRRMLNDPRSQALVDNFTGQWLYLRNLQAVQPDAEVFPNFDDGLRQALRRETELFFNSILRENRSALELLTANYSFVNERLAQHYGIPEVHGSEFRKVSVDTSQRGGLLGQGSILTVTSYANRTSPVLRGKWVLENLLGTPPPPPPPNVPSLKEVGDKPMTMRERLEEHRANAACAGCHKIMDPLGFALESYDAIGRLRIPTEGAAPIDVTGALLDGTKVNGMADLRSALLKDPTNFVSTLTKKLLTYSLGRGLEYYDAPAVRKITRDAAAQNYTLTALILDIVKSTPFQMRRSQS